MKIENDELDESKITLDPYNSDLNLVLSADRYSAHPLTNEGFAFMWAGARATHGFAKGKICYEVKVLEHLNVSHLPADEPNPHVVRVGFSVESSTMQLGEDPLSYGYGGTGKISTKCQFKDFGQSFQAGDVILAFVNMDNDPVPMGFAKNGKFLGWAYRISKSELKGQALFPHILTKNVSFECNFGQKDKPYFPLPDVVRDYTFANCVPMDRRVAGTRAPKKQDCEILMMCGIPGAGKSVWAADYSTKHPEKKYNVLGTNNIIDKMKVMGLPRKRNYAGRWDVLIQMATKCLNKMFEIGSKLRRNYILDQTNVYPNAQRRKMSNFKGFIRKAVVVVPTEQEYKRRCDKRDREEGKEVPDSAVLEMKANFKLPEKGDVFDEVIYTEIPKEEAEKLVRQYNEEGKAATGPPRKQFRPDSSPGFGNRGGFNSNQGGPPGRGGFSNRGGFEGNAAGFENRGGRPADSDRKPFGVEGGGRGGFDRNSGGYDSRGGFDEKRGGGFDGNRGGGFDGNRGGRGGFDGNRGGRGGFDGNRRGGFDGNRGGGFDIKRESDFDGNRGGGYDGNRGGGYDRNRGGGYDGNRGGGFDGNRGGGLDRNRGGMDGNRRGGFDGNRGGNSSYDSGRGDFDRNRGGYDSGSDRGRGGFGGGRGSFDRGGRGGFDGGSRGNEGGRGGYQDSRGGYSESRGVKRTADNGRYDQSPSGRRSPGGYGGNSQSSYGGGSSNYDNSRGGSSYRGGRGRGGDFGGSRPGGNRGGYSNSPDPYSSGGGYVKEESYDQDSSYGGGQGYQGASSRGSSGGRGGSGGYGGRGGGGYGSNEYGRESSGSYGGGYSDYGGQSQGGYGASSDPYSKGYGSGPQPPIKREPGVENSGYSNSGSRPIQGAARPSGRTTTRWSAAEDTPKYPERSAPTQDSDPYSKYGGAQIKSEPPSSAGANRYDSYSNQESSYGGYGQSTQQTAGYGSTQSYGGSTQSYGGSAQSYGYQPTQAASQSAWPPARTAAAAAPVTQPAAAAAVQSQWPQSYQTATPYDYMQYASAYAQSAPGAAPPAYGSAYSN